MNALDFVNLVSGQLGWGTETDVADLTEDGKKILVMSNAILSAMQNDKTWPELRVEGWINIEAPRTTDAYGSIADGGTTLTLAGASADSFTAADVGRLVQVGAFTPYYRIKTFTDTNNVELETAWKDETTALQTLVIGTDRYSLPSNCDRVLSGSMRNLSTGTQLEEVDPDQMRVIQHYDGLKLVQEEPSNFVISGLDSDGNKIMHVDRVSDEVYTLEYAYQKDHPVLSASTDKILYPYKYIMYIGDSVIAKLQRDVENSQVAVQTSQDSLKEAMRVGSNPNNGRDRMRIRVQGSSHGGYRRRR